MRPARRLRRAKAAVRLKLASVGRRTLAASEVKWSELGANGLAAEVVQVPASRDHDDDHTMTTNRWLVALFLALLLAAVYLGAVLLEPASNSNEDDNDRGQWLVLAPGEDLEEESFNAAQQDGAQLRQKRSTTTHRASRSERRPILNEFSFPPNLVQGMRFVLMCQVLDGDGPVQIKWFRDGRELGGPAGGEGSAEPELLAHSEELGASSLLFRRVQAQQAGNYTCLASNRHGASAYSSQMSVKVPPKWRVEPQDGHSIMGEQTSIDCQAIGNPNPFIRWKFQHLSQTPAAAAAAGPKTSPLELATARSLAPDELQANFKLINSNHHVQTLENGSLSIRQASREHEGLYLCEADNGVEPSLVKVVRLTVHQQAAFMDELQLLVAGQPQPPEEPGGAKLAGQPLAHALRLAGAQNHTNGGPQVRLVCRPLGEPPLTLDWLKDGQLIYSHTLGPDGQEHEHQELPAPANGRLHVTTSRQQQQQQVQSELLLVAPRRQDAGTYACAARNPFGRAERQLRLLLQEPPEPPQLVELGHVGSRSVALRWLAPYDGNSPILSYQVEFRRLEEDEPHWLESRPPTGHSERPASLQGPQQVQHTVHELEPLTRYGLRVVAVNGLARSRPSPSLALRTEEEVPSVVPSSVEATVLGSSLIRLRWTISYSPAHEIIDGFFVGYRSLESPPSDAPSSPNRSPEQPTFTYKTIRLTNQQQQQQRGQTPAEDQSSALLAPVSSFTKTLASPAPFSLPSSAAAATAVASGGQRTSSMVVVVVSAFEYEIGSLERNTEYTILIQCFNKKGAGPTSDPVVFKTLVNDPPDKLLLSTEEITESSIKIGWRFLAPSLLARPNLIARPQSEQPVDGFVLTYARLGPNNHRHSIKDNTNDIRQAARISQSLIKEANNNSSAIKLANGHQDQWQAVQLAPQQRSHQLRALDCGTAYAMKIWAFNKVGNGEPSDLITVATRGKAPVAPDKRSFVSINSTQVRLHLSAWYDGGCELDKFVVQYRQRGQQDWLLLSNNILKDQMSVAIRDLLPATGYELLVVAHNRVGPTEARYRFATLDQDGRQVQVLGPLLDGSQQDEADEYLEDESGGSVRREHWHELANHKSLAFFRHLLGSPWALLLSLSLFLLLCLLLLAVYRFSQGQTMQTTQAPPPASSHHPHKHNQDSSDGELAPPSVGAMNDSSLGDSPHLHLSSQFPLITECQYQSFCGQQPQQVGPDYAHRPSDLYLAQSNPTGDYGAAYASVPRPVDEQQQQQCLMQMLMMGNQQNQANQLEQANYAAALGTLTRGAKAMQQHQQQHYANYAATLRPSSQLMQQAAYQQRLPGGASVPADADSNNKPASSEHIAMSLLATGGSRHLSSASAASAANGGSTSSGASTSGFAGSGSYTTTSEGGVCEVEVFNGDSSNNNNEFPQTLRYQFEPSKTCDTTKPLSPYDVPFKKSYTKICNP